MTLATSKKLPYSWVTIIFMAIVHGVALLALLPQNITWPAIAMAAFLYWLTGCVGVTLGYHRLVAHKSFKVPKWLEYFLVFCGTLSCQSTPIEWIGLHRHHHAYSDHDNDHHTSSKGFWWSHMEWMFYEVPAKAEIPRFTKDIGDDPVYQFLSTFFIPIQVVLGLVLLAIGGWPMVLWGIFMRLVLVYHTTWFVNSATHKFGYRTYESGDQSTNCWWVALLAFGEGWHNNHHAFQYSARHGLQPWEFDLTWLIIQGLSRLGLATDIKLPDEQKLAMAKITQ